MAPPQQPEHRYNERIRAREVRLIGPDGNQLGIKPLPEALNLARQVDFDTKVRHMNDFLADGHKVKVTLQFRGREMAHPELGSKILDAVLAQLGTSAKVETQARLEGRNMTMVLAPEKKAVPKKSEAKEHKAPMGAELPANSDTDMFGADEQITLADTPLDADESAPDPA